MLGNVARRRGAILAFLLIATVAIGGWGAVTLRGAWGAAGSGEPPVPVAHVPRVANDPPVRPVMSRRPDARQPDLLTVARYLGGPDDFGRITSLRDVGEYLFVGDALMDPHISVIDLRTGDVITRFGRNGRGPREFQDVSTMGRGSTGSISVWVHDFALRRISLAVFENGDVHIARTVPLLVATSAEHPAPLGDGWVATGLYGDEAVLMFYSADGRPTGRAGTPPYSLRDVGHTVGVRLLNRAALSAHPVLTRFAVGFYSANRVDVYDSTGHQLVSVSGPGDLDVRYHVADRRFFWDRGNELAYVAMASNAKAILALRCQCPLGEEVEPDSTSRVLHAWSWDGAFIGEYQLGDKPVHALVASADGLRLFGSIDDPYPTVVEWVLPAELQAR